MNEAHYMITNDSKKMVQITSGDWAKHTASFSNSDNVGRGVIVYAKVTNPTEQLTTTMFDGVEVSTPDYFNGYNFHYFAWGNLYHRISRGYTTGAEWLTVQVPGVAVEDDYYTMESQWYGQTSDENEDERVTVLKGFVDGVEKLSATNADYTSRTYMGFNSWGEGVWLIDRVMIRKCQAVEPAAELTATFQRPAVSNPTPATQTTSFVYDDYNKLTGITYPDSATETLTYNDNGQLTRSQKSTGEVTAYEWNDQGMLKKVILPTGEPIEYKYDGNQRLVSRKSSDGVDKFVQSGWDIMTKMDDVGKRTYYTGMSAVLDEDNQTYFHYDHLGNTRLITDKEGNIVKNISYAAYGKPTDSSGNEFNTLSLKDFPYLFVGNSGIVYDHKTQLHNMRFRWFSSKIMRFLSPDILEDINRYSYAGGNPVNYVDIFGLWDFYYAKATRGFYAIPTNPGDNAFDLFMRGYFPLLYGKTPNGKLGYDVTSGVHPNIRQAIIDQANRERPPYNRTFTPVDYNDWCFNFAFGYDNFRKGKRIDEYNILEFINKKKNNGELIEIFNKNDVMKGDIIIWDRGPDEKGNPIYKHAGIVTGLDDFMFHKFGFGGPHAIGRIETNYDLWGGKGFAFYKANMTLMREYYPGSFTEEEIEGWKRDRDNPDQTDYNRKIRETMRDNITIFAGKRRYFRKICKKGVAKKPSNQVKSFWWPYR